MNTKPACIVFGADSKDHDHYHDGNGGSHCHYHKPVDITDYVAAVLAKGGRLVIRPMLIEASDQQEPLHRHRGLVAAYVAHGVGSLNTDNGPVPIRASDSYIVEPGAGHLSVASPHQTLVHYGFYIGEPNDIQDAY